MGFANKIPRSGKQRDEYIEKLNKLNEFDRLVENLCNNELSIKMLEMAVNEMIRRSKIIPEGVQNLLVSYESGGLLSYNWMSIRNIIGNMELSYRRGIQEGADTRKLHH
jgi:hypothetical protein